MKLINTIFYSQTMDIYYNHFLLSLFILIVIQYCFNFSYKRVSNSTFYYTFTKFTLFYTHKKTLNIYN
jgi:hypothetical protein